MSCGWYAECPFWMDTFALNFLLFTFTLSPSFVNLVLPFWRQQWSELYTGRNCTTSPYVYTYVKSLNVPLMIIVKIKEYAFVYFIVSYSYHLFAMLWLLSSVLTSSENEIIGCEVIPNKINEAHAYSWWYIELNL